jgi:hypothetical protein
MRKNLLLNLFIVIVLQSLSIVNASLLSKLPRLNPARLLSNAAKKQLVRNVHSKPEGENPICNALWGTGGGLCGGFLGWGLGSTIDDIAGGSINNVPGGVGFAVGASSLSYLVGGKIGLHSAVAFCGSVAVLKAYRNHIKKKEIRKKI